MVVHSLPDGLETEQGCPADDIDIDPEDIPEFIIAQTDLAHRHLQGSFKAGGRAEEGLAGFQRSNNPVNIITGSGNRPDTCHIYPLPAHGSALVSGGPDIIGHCPDRVEHLLALGRIGQLDSILLVQKQDYFQCVDGIQSESLISEERSLSINVFRSHILQIQRLYELSFEF